MVQIGSARLNESGKTTGGKAGDQTAREVSTQAWYMHIKGWIVLRAKDPAVREKIAYAMAAACANEHIGYCQSHRTGATLAAAPYGYDPACIQQDTETDCSELVRLCCLYAGIKVPSFNTASEKTVLEKTGHFTVYTDGEQRAYGCGFVRWSSGGTGARGRPGCAADKRNKSGACKSIQQSAGRDIPDNSSVTSAGWSW